MFSTSRFAPPHRRQASNQKFGSKLWYLALFSLILSGCNTYRIDQTWPSELPPQKVFIKGFLDKRNLESATDAQLGYHLGWIKKFYQGTALYPNGWLSASDQFIESVKIREERRVVETRMYKLGILIANEWAQDNDIRLINNANIATWGSALRTAAENEDQMQFLEKVELDVKLLLTEQLKARQIKYERYFPEESFDDF